MKVRCTFSIFEADDLRNKDTAAICEIETTLTSDDIYNSILRHGMPKKDVRPHKTTHKNTFLKEVRSRRPPVILTPTYEPTENFLKRHYATAFSLMVISRSDTTSCGLTQFYLLTALSVYMASGLC